VFLPHVAGVPKRGMTTQRDLVGYWALETFKLRSSEGETAHSLGLDATGLLVYDAGGSFAARLAGR